MTRATETFISSRDNAWVKRLRRLAQQPTAYRKQRQVWLEGEHLCQAALAHGWTPALAVFSASFWPIARTQPAWHATEIIVLADPLFAAISALESPAQMACVVDLPAAPVLQPDAATLVLDCVQDAGNVGSMLRSAAAFGFAQVLALQGSAALWSPKVLRAGMGAHFGLRMLEGLDESALAALQVPLLATSVHDGDWLHRLTLPWPCAWIMGHEGQGVRASLLQRAHQRVRIVQPGGQESLNVAAAAAVWVQPRIARLPVR